MTLDMQVSWINLKHALSPNWWSSGKKEIYKYVGDINAKKLSQSSLPSKNAGSIAEKNQMQQAIQNANAARGGDKSFPIPYASPNAFKNPIVINNINKFHFDENNKLKYSNATADVMP